MWSQDPHTTTRVTDNCLAQFVYGCLYLLFEAYPIVFIEGHGFNSGEDGLAFLPLFVGGVIGTIIVSSD